jgi:hypothetical protein
MVNFTELEMQNKGNEKRNINNQYIINNRYG